MFAAPDSYERFMGRWSRQLAPLFVDFARLPDGGQVLDVGSGVGSLAFALAERNPGSRVIGIDPSAEFVAHANRRNRMPSRVHFETGDAQAMRFADASFRAGLSLLVWNFVPNPGKALAEMRRVTELGGVIAAAVWDYGDQMQMLRAFWDAATGLNAQPQPRDEKHMPLCRAGELGDLWRQGGLNDVDEQPLDFAMRFETFADYWDPFLLEQGPAGAYVQTLSGDSLRALREAVKRRLSLSQENTAFSLQARAWAVRGTAP